MKQILRKTNLYFCIKIVCLCLIVINLTMTQDCPFLPIEHNYSTLRAPLINAHFGHPPKPSWLSKFRATKLLESSILTAIAVQFFISADNAKSDFEENRLPIPVSSLTSINHVGTHLGERIPNNGDEIHRKIEQLIMELGDGTKQKTAIAELQKIGEPAIRQLIDGLGGPTRMSLIKALMEMKKSAIVLLNDALLHHKDFYVRRSVARILGDMGDTDAVLSLITALRDPDYLIVIEACDSLGKIGDVSAIEPLVRLSERTYLDTDYGTYNNYYVKISALGALCNMGHKESIEKLLHIALSCETTVDSSVKRHIANSLAKVKDIKLLDPLFLTINDPAKNSSVKQIALRVLLAAVDEVHLDVVGLLEPMLRNEALSLNWDTVPILKKVEGPRVWDILLSILDSEDRYSEWSVASALLSRLQDKSDALNKLVSVALIGQNMNMRLSAVESLGKLEDERAIPVLLQIARGNESFLTSEAFVSIGEISGRVAIEALIEICDVDFFTTTTIKSGFSRIKDQELARELLITALQKADSVKREGDLLIALSAIAQCEDVLPIIKILEQRGDMLKTIESDIVDMFYGIGENAIPIIIPYIQSREPLVRRMVIKALGLLRGQKSVSTLMEILQKADEDFEVRVVAVESLGQIGDKQAVVPLIKLLEDKSEHPSVRVSAAISLGLLKDERAVKPLMALLNDKDTSIEEASIKALIRIGGHFITQSLIDILPDSDENTQVKIVEILGKIGEKQAVVPLIKLLEDKSKHPSVRVSAAISLGLLKDERAVESLFYALVENQNESFERAVEDSLIAMKDETIKTLCQIMEGMSFSEVLFGKGLRILVKIYIYQHSRNEIALKYLINIIPQIKEILKTSDLELLENGFFVFNVLLTSKEVELKIRKEIWDIYYSFISGPYDFPFFIDPAVPPIFKSTITNSIGFSLISVLKGTDFSEQREGCLGKLVSLTEERCKSQDEITYMLGRYMAYNLTGLLCDPNIKLAEGVRAEIEQLNKMNIGPDASIFKNNVLTVRIFFQESKRQDMWRDAYINEYYGFKCTYTDKNVCIYEKRNSRSGRIARLIIPVAPLHFEDFNSRIFKNIEEEVGYIVYNGHDGLGVWLKGSFEDVELCLNPLIIQLATCSSEVHFANIRRRFPRSSPILTKEGAWSLDGLLVFAHTLERLLEYGENTRWCDLYADISANLLGITDKGEKYHEKKQGNYFFPGGDYYHLVSERCGDNVAFQVGRQFRYDLNLDYTPVSNKDRETPRDKASDIIGLFIVYLRHDPFLAKHNSCAVDLETEGLNKGWFWPSQDTKEPIRIRKNSVDDIDRYLIKLNIGYRELSRESLMLIGLVETAKYIGDQFKEESPLAIKAIEEMSDIKRENLNAEKRYASRLIGVSLKDTKDIFKKLGITREDEKAQIVNPLRGFLLGMEYLRKNYKLAQRRIARSESTNEEKMLARRYIEGVKNLYGQFLEKYNFPLVSFEDMIKILDVSQNNPTIWYLAYIAKQGIAIPEDIGKMKETEVGISSGMGMGPHSREGIQLAQESGVREEETLTHQGPFMGITVPVLDSSELDTSNNNVPKLKAVAKYLLMVKYNILGARQQLVTDICGILQHVDLINDRDYSQDIRDNPDRDFAYSALEYLIENTRTGEEDDIKKSVLGLLSDSRVGNRDKYHIISLFGTSYRSFPLTYFWIRQMLVDASTYSSIDAEMKDEIYTYIRLGDEESNSPLGQYINRDIRNKGFMVNSGV